MKYKQQLLDLILEGSDDEMLNWIEAQPLLEQPDIFRELKELAEELAAENGDKINIEIEGMEEFDQKINEYEEKILDEKLAEANYIMALEQQEKAMDEIADAINGVREYVIECIVTNAPNAEPMRELAQQIIKLEMDSGDYNPENWKRIL